MARIFSIQFAYDNSQHSAIVSVKELPFYTEYNLALAPELLALLPSNKIIGSPSGHLRFQLPGDEVDPALMQAIIGAVAGHLQLRSVSS